MLLEPMVGKIFSDGHYLTFFLRVVHALGSRGLEIRGYSTNREYTRSVKKYLILIEGYIYWR